MRFALSALLLAACTPEDVSLGAYVLDAGVTFDARVTVDARVISPYFEAEDGLLSGGFSVVAFADASAGRALSPPLGTFDMQPGEARALYRFEVPSDGSYVLWGRIRGPGAANNRFWFQVDDRPWTKWRISTGDIFWWDGLHEDANYGNPLHFDLRTGEHRLTIANCVDGVLLDRFYVTADGDKPPNATTCSPPHSIELGGKCLPSCGAQNGRHCGQQMCVGKTIIVAYDCDVCCED